MPRVARINIAPVRSLGLEHREAVELTERGVVEDRRFFVRDPENTRVVDQLIAGPMVQVTAWTDPDATSLRLTFPDGQVVEGEVELGAAVETPIHHRVGVGHDVVGPWARALSEFLGREVILVRCDRPGGTRSGKPTTLVSDGSLDAIGGVLGAGAVDPRRFRMLFELDGADPHVEDTWIGSCVSIGEAVLRVGGGVARCAMTTHDPETGVRDLDTLRAIKDYRGLTDGKDLMFGVWADVVRPGWVRVGDEVAVEPA